MQECTSIYIYVYDSALYICILKDKLLLLFYGWCRGVGFGFSLGFGMEWNS